MHSIRYRIAALAGGSVLLTLLLIMAAFNVIIRHEMQNNAAVSLQAVLGSGEVQDGASTIYSPEIIFVYDNSEQTISYLPKEQKMIAWCTENDASTMQKAQIGGNTYYIQSAEPSEELQNSFSSYTITDGDTAYTYGFMEDKPSIRTCIAYVDITGELHMIWQINLVFLIAALLIGSISITIGYITGKQLEQNQLAQKQFFENTSHELKTPLTSIRGYAEGISTGVITDYPKTGRVIAAQTEKMSALIEEILCMAKLESGSVTLTKENVELSAFLQDCLMPFEGTVLTRNLSVHLDLHPMTVSADPDKLEHAVSNLLTNALKYARSEIRISCGSGRVCIENDCEPLTDDALRHLFDRFYTGRDGNTGIGLSIARDLIALHGWKLIAQHTERGIAFVTRMTDMT